MTLSVGLAIAAAAALGACVRHLLGELLNSELPVGTLITNLAASFALGLISGLPEPWFAVAAIGGLGALSTWSSAANEVANLARRDEGALAVAYLSLTAAAGVVAAWLGVAVATALGWR